MSLRWLRQRAPGRQDRHFATNRAGSVLKYSGLFNGFQVDTSYKFDGGDTEETSSKTAMLPTVPPWPTPSRPTSPWGPPTTWASATRAVKRMPKLRLLSAKYDNKALYAALDMPTAGDFLATGKDHTGWEGALGYNFESGFGLMALWNKQKVEQLASLTTTHRLLHPGCPVQFNKNLRVIGEYRINNLDSHDSGKLNTKDDFQLAARYDF